nr:hypothetical protein [Alphaproteobacteria bacterium]
MSLSQARLASNNKADRVWKIRRAKTKDVEAICKLREEVWLDTYPNEQYGVTVEDLKRVYRFSAPDRQKVFQQIVIQKPVVVVEHTTLRASTDATPSMLAYAAVDRPTNEITMIYVRRAWQGHGIGSACMQEQSS